MPFSLPLLRNILIALIIADKVQYSLMIGRRKHTYLAQLLWLVSMQCTYIIERNCQHPFSVRKHQFNGNIGAERMFHKWFVLLHAYEPQPFVNLECSFHLNISILIKMKNETAQSYYHATTVLRYIQPSLKQKKDHDVTFKSHRIAPFYRLVIYNNNVKI